MCVEPAGTWVKIIGFVFRAIEGIGEVLAAGTMSGFDVQDVQPDIPLPTAHFDGSSLWSLFGRNRHNWMRHQTNEVSNGIPTCRGNRPAE